MQTNISARHGQLSSRTQERIREKTEKLHRYFDRVTAVEVTVDLEHRDNPSVELKVSAQRSDVFVAAESSSDVISALDGALHKMEQQIRRHKQKRTNRRGTPLKHLELPAEEAPGEGSEPASEQQEQREPK